MGHILWWLWLISIHIEHSASESRRVQWRMSAATLPTLNSLIRLERRRNLTPPHGTAKSMCGQGPVYQFASTNSIREVCTPSPHATVWLLSMLRALGCDVQDFEKSCLKKNKNQGLWEEGHWLWNKWKSRLAKCHCESEWVIQYRYLCRVWEIFFLLFKGFVRYISSLLIVPWGTPVRWFDRMKSVQVERGGAFAHFKWNLHQTLRGERFEPTHHFSCWWRRVAWN